MIYHQEIKPLLETRCVACHACYDAPFQLKLGSTNGINRGATKQLVYDGGRLTAATPTRLFIDAKEQVDRLINTSKRLLQKNAEYQKLLHDLGASIPAI